MGAHPPELQGIGQRGDSKQFGISVKMAYTWDNRVKYIVRYMYDIDNNGFLDINDFDCLAVRVTLIEAHGDFPADTFASNKKVMSDLWTEIAELADFNKDGEVSVEEFKQAVQTHCKGKKYDDFPAAFKVFIMNQFKTIDVNGDGLVGVDEYRLDCITRSDETSNSCYLFGPLKVVE